MMLYNFYTAFVTTGVLVFIAIYNTSFINVVTLGGTVLGSAVIAFGTALLAMQLQKLPSGRVLRCVLEGIGCGCITAGTATFLPGWIINLDGSALLFFLVLCALVALINESALKI
jgi:hypothetical protein